MKFFELCVQFPCNEVEPTSFELHYRDVIQKLLILSLALSVVAGCSSSTPEVKTATSASAAGSEAKMVKCELCGSEFTASEMVTHEGKQVCKACKTAHGG